MSLAAPALAAERCLNAVNRAAGCLRCATACPAPGAIRLMAGLPVLDESACVRCGVCLHVCPSDAYGGADWLEVGLERAVAAAPRGSADLETAAAAPRGPLALVCDRHPAPSETTTAAETVVQAMRCLASLSPARLLAMAEERELWLDDTPCGACEIGAAAVTLRRSARLAAALGGAGQRPGKVRLASEVPPAAPRRVGVLDASAPPVARRALFTGLASRVRASLDAFPAALQDPVTRAGRRLPAERRRLLAAVSSWSSAVEGDVRVAGSELATVRVDHEGCSACGVCDRACPTGALRFEAVEGAFRLELVAAACVACRVCVGMCPEAVVSLEEGVQLADLAAPAERLLVWGEVTACPSCGAAVAKRNGDGAVICHSCRATGGPTRHGRDAAGLMDDLLRRSGDGVSGGE